MLIYTGNHRILPDTQALAWRLWIELERDGVREGQVIAKFWSEPSETQIQEQIDRYLREQN